jgi:hypothetical protein
VPARFQERQLAPFIHGDHFQRGLGSIAELRAQVCDTRNLIGCGQYLAAGSNDASTALRNDIWRFSAVNDNNRGLISLHGGSGIGCGRQRGAA